MKQEKEPPSGCSRREFLKTSGASVFAPDIYNFAKRALKNANPQYLPLEVLSSLENMPPFFHSIVEVVSQTPNVGTSTKVYFWFDRDTDGCCTLKFVQEGICIDGHWMDWNALRKMFPQGVNQCEDSFINEHAFPLLKLEHEVYLEFDSLQISTDCFLRNGKHEYSLNINHKDYDFEDPETIEKSLDFLQSSYVKTLQMSPSDFIDNLKQKASQNLRCHASTNTPNVTKLPSSFFHFSGFSQNIPSLAVQKYLEGVGISTKTPIIDFSEKTLPRVLSPEIVTRLHWVMKKLASVLGIKQAPQITNQKNPPCKMIQSS